MINKKVLNAQTCIYNNIKFKSKLEMYCYKYFKDNSLNIVYEPGAIKIVPGFQTNVSVWLPVKDRKTKQTNLKLKRSNILPVTYTPDFKLQYNNNIIFIETKGKPNDVYPLKRKLFLRWLTENGKKNHKYWFFEPHTQQQVRETYNIILNQIINV